MNGLAIDPATLKVGENRRPCPRCDRGSRDTALAIRRESDGSSVYHCHRCGWSGRINPQAVKRTPATAIQPARRDTRPRGLSAWASALWSATRPLCGAAADYLRARLCVLPPADGHLRQMPALSHPSGYTGPALVALITDVSDGTPLSLHRTWVQPDGKKASIDRPRLLLGKHPIAGGVIRLWPDEAVTAGLGIAEGIETALTLAHGFTPAWSCIDAGHLAAFPVLPGIRELVIAADNDVRGRQAAEQCAARWAAVASVRVVAADAEGCDLNDEVHQWTT